ncbi:MAG: glycosyltransferase family protein [Bacteroidia bacterium]
MTKILYAIQGTGNGHISRAIEIIPELQKRGKVDILISGFSSDIELPFEIKYKFKGLSFVFGQKGGINYFQTWSKNRIRRFYKEVKKLPVNDYDLVISDFEPVSSWACFLAEKTCIGLSNQAAVLAPNAPRAEDDDKLGRLVLNYYAPVTAAYGFHSQRYNNSIYTPIIRKEVRRLKTKDDGHYTVYLPAYADEKIINRLSYFSDARWEVFSKHTKKAYIKNNVLIRPIESKLFMESLASCKGILCGAGFATPCEALFLKKKLMVIPMKIQYEQQCNAEALKQMGVAVMKSLKKKHRPVLQEWLNSDTVVKVDYPDNVSEIVDVIFRNHVASARMEKLRKVA